MIPAALVIGLAVAGAGAAWNTGRDAESKAVAQAAALIPRAQWTVASRTFDPFGNEVDYGAVHLGNVVGPSWVVEMTAPGYQAAVAINAITGDVTDSGAAAATR